jgi:predicted dehydrogenase
MKSIALLGASHIHVPGFMKRFREREGLAISHVWDHIPDRRAKWAAEMGAQSIADPAEALNDASVDAVIVCSETVLHTPLVSAVAAAGKPVFVEKPLGMDGADSTGMAQAIAAAGVPFQTGFFMRGAPVNLFLKARIQDGSFGRITRVRQSNCHAGLFAGYFDTDWRWMADRGQAGVGAFGDLGAHALDLLLWWLGPVESAAAVLGTATGRFGDIDEYGEGLLHFENGVAATLGAGWVDLANPVTTEISGTAGHAVVFNKELFFRSQHIAGATGTAPWTALPPAQPAGFDLFLDWLQGNASTANFVSAAECAERDTVMEMMYAAA